MRGTLVRLVIASLAAAVLGSVGPHAPVARADHRALDDVTRAELQVVLDRFRRDEPLPGISASVLMPDGDRWHGVSGRGSVAAGAPPLTTRTTFVAASITKTFVAALALRLEERGVLDVDDPLARWMPEYPGATRITLRQLLDHTSGLHDYFRHPRYEELVFGRPRHVWALDEILALVGDPYFPPGGGWRYSNTNYVLLGEVVERATGSPIGELIRTEFLEPLGLSDTYFQGHDELPADGAHGYLRANGQWVGWSDGTRSRPNTSAATVAWAAGAIVSTPHDLTTWADALYGGDVLQPVSLERMLDFGEIEYGLGARPYLHGGRQAWGHGGSLRGFQAKVWYVPSLGISLAVMTNRGRVDEERMIQRLATVLFRHVAPDATPPVTSVPEVSLGAGSVGPTAPLGVAWTTVEEESGVARFELEASTDGGPWTAVATPPVRLGERPPSGVALALPTKRAFQLRLRAIDRAGNVGDWSASTPFTAIPRQESSSSVTYTGTWKARSDATAWAHGLAKSRERGATASIAVAGDEVAWVAHRGPTRGRARVRIDGVTAATVDLGTPVDAPRSVVFRTALPDDGTRHTVAIEVLGTAGRPRVDLDGFLILADATSPTAP